ncbi:unnamed protein product [Arctia plantaginis]|uniref:Uncharacterized protein n=1 Tax=Arctia plantaginis TaxID=874455 RepID=A0A8S1BSQ2_ARCPL|nr:unnamed protein product [Arctia plantaginis]
MVRKYKPANFSQNGMPPKTNAERQKAYRERLEKDKPSKYGELRVKHLEKVKENIKKKKEILTEEEKQESKVEASQC